MNSRRLIRETDIENYLVAEVARRLHGAAYKTVSPTTVGFPDRLLVWKGTRHRPHMQLVEVKKPGEKPTKRQEIEHQRLWDLGQNVTIVDDKKSVDALLTELAEWL